MKLDFTVPIHTVSGLNVREHPMARSRRVKNERRKTLNAFRLSNPPKLQPLLLVTLTRVAPRPLDAGDNLSSSMKGIRDQVACILGVNDGGPLVRWECEQERGEYAVRVRVEEIARGEVDRVGQVPATTQEAAQKTPGKAEWITAPGNAPSRAPKLRLSPSYRAARGGR